MDDPLEKNSSKTVLIAGCGYVGRALALHLVESGRKVIGLTHSQTSAEELRREVTFDVHACDISSPDEVAKFAQNLPIDSSQLQIVHCASSGRGKLDAYDKVYHQGCRNLATSFPGACLLFTSSTSVYPQIAGEVVTELSSAEPERETGKILRKAENFVISQGGIVARLAGLYGPGRSVLLKKFLNKTAIIETGPSRFLNQIHRDDVVGAIATLLIHEEDARGEIFNVSDGNPTSQKATYIALSEHFGLPRPPEGPPDHNRKRGWTHKQISNQKLRDFGWEPIYPTFLDAVRTDAEALCPKS